MFRCGKTLMALALVVAVPAAAVAQATTAPARQRSDRASTPAAPPAPTAELLKPEQLEALVAPIALYPDELLANVLAASTYPLEVVQADRWLKERKSLKGDALKTEVDKQSWDDSVKALASTADVLTMMSDKLEWTKNLGDALLAQQPDVMDAIQRLRTKAYDNKKLVTTKQQKVSVQTQESKQAIVIEQADPNTMYVPYYDPATVYGSWPYAEYPPYYFGYPSYIGAGVIAAGLAFGTAWAIGRWGNYWGGGCNWGNRNVYVNHRTTKINVGIWQHNPAHRGRACGTTMPMFSSASATTMCEPARQTGWISAAATASRCLSGRIGPGDRAAIAQVIGPVIARATVTSGRGRSCEAAIAARRRRGKAGDRAKGGGDRAKAGDRCGFKSGGQERGAKAANRAAAVALRQIGGR